MSRARRTTPRYADLDVAALLQHTASTRTLAELLGETPRKLQRYAATGLTLELAESYAVAVGCHPSEVWPCWFEVVVAATGTPCPECPSKFLPYGRRKFCSGRCKARAAARRRRQDPEYRARQIAYLRDYREQSRETARAYARRYYQANRERLIAEAVERKRRAKKAA